MLAPLISQVKSFDFGTEQTVRGWVRSVRSQQTVTFIVLNDGSDLAGVQLVCPEGSAAKELADSLAIGSSLIARGAWERSPAAGQAGELRVSGLELVGCSDSEYPVQNKRHSFEYLRTIGHLRPRTNTFGAMLRVRSALALATHSFFAGHGFHHLHTPIITGSDCEGAGEMFGISAASTPGREFFGQKAGLTVSGQLEAEAFAQALSRVYTFGPTFRAENSNTSRHAAEFWMVEPEMAFADLGDDIRLAEGLVRHLCRHALDACPADMAFFDAHVEKGLVERLRRLADTGFAVISYTEAIGLLEKATVSFQEPVFWGADLRSEHERYLSGELGPVFVTDYPRFAKPFYMRVNDDERTVAAMDLLVPRVGELIGGSQREERHAVLADRMAEVGIDPASMGWYLETRRWGTTPHAGFGLGFERLLMLVTGLENIRDVIPCPRTPGSIGF